MQCVLTPAGPVPAVAERGDCSAGGCSGARQQHSDGSSRAGQACGGYEQAVVQAASRAIFSVLQPSVHFSLTQSIVHRRESCCPERCIMRDWLPFWLILWFVAADTEAVPDRKAADEHLALGGENSAEPISRGAGPGPFSA